jgi:hypothetical protein
MADQAESDTVAGGAVSEPAGFEPQAPMPGRHLSSAEKFEQLHGRPASWMAVAIIFAGFVTGGIGLITGPAWWLFWAGVAVAAVGGILGLATGIFNDWY